MPDLRGSFGTSALYTTDPDRKREANSGENLSLHILSPDGEVTWHSIVEGPGSATVPLHCRISGGRLSITLGNAPHPVAALKAGEWSEWLRVTFAVSGRGDIPGLFRLRAMSLNAGHVELYRTGNGERLGAPDRPLPTIGRVKVVPRRWPKAKPGEEIAHFDAGGVPGSVTLATCERREAVRPGEVLPVALTWTVQASPKRDYAVFLHLEDDAGKVYGYGDGAPRGGNYPIWAWEEGEVIADDRMLAVAADAPPGHYRIVVGLYDGSGRVTAYGADGARLPGDAVDLGMVEVR